MSQVRLVLSHDLLFVSTRHRAPTATLQTLSEGERNTETRVVYPGTDNELQLFAVIVQPNGCRGSTCPVETIAAAAR